MSDNPFALKIQGYFSSYIQQLNSHYEKEFTFYTKQEDLNIIQGIFNQRNELFIHKQHYLVKSQDLLKKHKIELLRLSLEIYQKEACNGVVEPSKYQNLEECANYIHVLAELVKLYKKQCKYLDFVVKYHEKRCSNLSRDLEYCKNTMNRIDTANLLKELDNELNTLLFNNSENKDINQNRLINNDLTKMFQEILSEYKNYLVKVRSDVIRTAHNYELAVTDWALSRDGLNYVIKKINSIRNEINELRKRESEVYRNYSVIELQEAERDNRTLKTPPLFNRQSLSDMLDIITSKLNRANTELSEIEPRYLKLSKKFKEASENKIYREKLHVDNYYLEKSALEGIISKIRQFSLLMSTQPN